MELYRESADYIRRFVRQAPRAGIILGSGLGDLADAIESPVVIPYESVPHFCSATAMGHKGNLIAGNIGGKPVVAMQGRFHYYEGYTMQQVTWPVRVMHLLGVRFLFVSNAAGGINPCLRRGDFMIIRDHINLMPNPLIGANIDDFGPRFPDMTRPYDPALIALAESTAARLGISLRKGVYIGGTGPSYETPAEYAFFGKIGADAVGMSTVPEVIVARHCGMRVFGVSVIANEGFDFSGDFENDGQDVLDAVASTTSKLSLLFKEMIVQLLDKRP